MRFTDFHAYPLWLNLGLFGLSAFAVWIAGTKVTRYADAIAIKTGIGHVAIGMVLLGGIASLPEVAIAIFSALAGSPALAVNNLLGGITMQKAILAGVDGLIAQQALTVISASPVMLLQAALSMLLLGVAAANAVGDTLLLGTGAWSWILLGLYIFSIWMISTSKERRPWIADNQAVPGSPLPATESQRGKDMALKSALWKTIAAGAVILIAGFFLSQTADAIAAQTGLGLSFVGAVLLAMSTSPPELSTVVSAVRLGRYELAISDILGTNLFNVALIFPVDAVYAGKPVLAEADRFPLVAALLGAMLTVICLIGLVERRNRTIGRMGIDSLSTLAVYGAGLYLLYQLR